MGQPIVQVVWRDAYFDFDRDGNTEDRDDYLVTTFGCLLNEDAKFYHIASEVLPDDNYRAVTHIPKVLVESCTELERKQDERTTH